MATLRTNILGIDFENPFLLSSAPPTAFIESIDKAFEMGWGGAVLKTIVPDELKRQEASPRYAVLKENRRIIGFQNIELLSHQTVQYWCDGIKYLKQKYPSKVIIANVMAPVHKTAWQTLINTLDNTPIDAFELGLSCPHDKLPKRPLAYPSINHEVCTRCGKCVMRCGESEHQALQLNDGYITVDKMRCVGCGLCRFVCPVGAIDNK